MKMKKKSARKRKKWKYNHKHSFSLSFSWKVRKEASVRVERFLGDVGCLTARAAGVAPVRRETRAGWWMSRAQASLPPRAHEGWPQWLTVSWTKPPAFPLLLNHPIHTQPSSPLPPGHKHRVSILRLSGAYLNTPTLVTHTNTLILPVLPLYI